MKHTNIAKILGWDEVPETKEGFFLQPEEAASIDAALATAGTAETLAADLKSANEICEGHVATIATMTTAATTASETIAANATKITELEATVVALGKNASGKGSTLRSATDENTEVERTGALPRFDSPDHPANKAAARYVKPKKD